MKITFKAYGPSVDHIILGLAKSGIPVSAQVSALSWRWGFSHNGRFPHAVG